MYDLLAKRRNTECTIMNCRKQRITLIKDVFQVKPGETVVLTCDSLSCMNVVNAVASSAHAADALPMIIKFPAPDGVGQAADPNCLLSR